MRRFVFSSLFALCFTNPALAETVKVFAAASLKTALDQVAADFTAQTGNQVVISYAGSNTLAKQILNGAPADIFISANTAWMDELEKAGLLVTGSRKDILKNILVLIAHGKDAPHVAISEDLDLTGLLAGNRLAMAMVDAVPAGQYGKAALISLGLWDSVAASVAQAENVRAALALVARDEAPFGIVYATDAKAEPSVSVVGRFPPESYPAITYPAALLNEARDAADAGFFAALTAPEAAAHFTAEGFTMLTP